MQPLAEWQYWIDLLTFGTDKERRRVCEELKDFGTLPVKRLFNESFDFRA